MFTKKILLSTFGTKITPYGFEYGGSESFLRAHQEYKWKYEEWKRLCHLVDIAV